MSALRQPDFTTTELPDPEQFPELYDSVPVKRAIAWAVDAAVIWLLTMVVVIFTAFIGLFFLGFLLLIVSFLYRWSTLANGSATWGMRLMSIELRDAEGRRFDATQAFLHTLGYSLSLAFAPVQMISVVLMAVTARGQGVTDHVLGSSALNRTLD
ncbi:RDD family protein [Pseudooceanicola aestuarii]|uniref:RDD family protein n=1 Tax=Pseudooceanicola aestuarii TaxID=2697319 RepID=UPI0013CFB825|nr:RDD family protein [Pseudooceanicola aestuarii]